MTHWLPELPSLLITTNLDFYHSFDGYTETSISGGTTTTTKFYAAAGQPIAMNMSNAIYYLLADFRQQQ